MKKIKAFVSKFISPELPIRLCILNMMSVIGILGAIVSVATTYIMHINNGQLFSMVASVIVLIFILILANKMRKLNLAAILICGLIGFLLFPVMYLRGGGIYSGMPIWFMMVIVFEAILIEGKAKYIMSFSTAAFYVGLIMFSYYFPEYLTYFESDQQVFLDVAQSFGFVGICIIGIISFQMNMYERALKRTEIANAEAERAKEEAQAANATKSIFLANMSHEIRTPMGVIMGMNEMIQRECEKEEVQEYSRDIDAAAKTLLSIINDILDFSKIESGKMNIVEVEYKPKKLLSDIQNIARVRQEETGLTFDLKVTGELPDKVVGDDLRIKQCLINIVGNAFKYTKQGGVTLEVSSEYREGDVYMTYSVADTGTGIREEEMGKLFDSFVRLNEGNTRAIQGTGLGLNICNRLLELMDSKLEVQSTWGVGSRFYFTIKQKLSEQTVDQVVSEPQSCTCGAEKNGATLSGPDVARSKSAASAEAFTAPDARVLVVDDNAMNVKVFCGLLKKTMIQVDRAYSGMEAIELVRSNHYDMIFLDNMMPVMNGEETFQKMKEEKLIENTPVIMLTADALVGMREHFLEVGFDEYLSKPIEYKKLERILKQFL